MKEYIEVLEEVGFEKPEIFNIIGKVYFYLATGEKTWEQNQKEYKLACELGVRLLQNQEKKVSVPITFDKDYEWAKKITCVHM